MKIVIEGHKDAFEAACIDGWMTLDECKAAKLNKEDGLYYLMEEQ